MKQSGKPVNQDDEKCTLKPCFLDEPTSLQRKFCCINALFGREIALRRAADLTNQQCFSVFHIEKSASPRLFLSSESLIPYGFRADPGNFSLLPRQM
jgi:hypothetical protein